MNFDSVSLSNISLSTSHSGVGDYRELNLNSFEEEVDQVYKMYHAFSGNSLWTPSMRDTFQLKLEQFKMKAIADLTLVKEQIGKKDEIRFVFIATQIAQKMEKKVKTLYHEYDTEHNQRNRVLNASKTAIENATLGKKLLQDVKDAATLGAAITVGEVAYQTYTSSRITRTFQQANTALVDANLNAAAAKIKLEFAQQAESALKSKKLVNLESVKLHSSESITAAERHMKDTAKARKAAKGAEAAAKAAMDASIKPMGSVFAAAATRGAIITGSVLAVKIVVSGGAVVADALLGASPAH